jgi:hypothetical protein
MGPRAHCTASRTRDARHTRLFVWPSRRGRAPAGFVGFDRVYMRSAMTRCGHPLCQLLGDGCSLATGRSRGCRTGPRTALPFEPELIEEVCTLLAQLGPPPGDAGGAERQRAAATRLAFLFRREARNDRNLLGLAAEDEIEPELRVRLAALCRRRA